MEQLSVMIDSYSILFGVRWLGLAEMPSPQTPNSELCLLPQIQKHDRQRNDSSEEINGIALHLTRLNAFYKTGQRCCCIRNSIHQPIHNIFIDPRCGATNEIENYFK